MVDKENSLNISEKFYSIQAEGNGTGWPAYFIRLKGCSLSCGFSKKAVSELYRSIKDKEGYMPGGFDHEYADLYREGKATWVCDSASVWLRGKRTSFENLIDDWKEQEIVDLISSNVCRLIWTGGEPTMPGHQKDITNFLNHLYNEYEIVPYNEIETNGIHYIESGLYTHLDQINCSVKLANSGMEKERRIVPEAIERIKEHKNHWFKFVISTEDCIKEIYEDFIQPFDIDPLHICMMPGLDKQEDFHERTKFCMEMGKKYGLRALTRLHISSWGSTTGV